MSSIPTIRASVTLLPELQRGRDFNHYRPHIVVGPTTQRVAKLEGRTLVEPHQGVDFLGGDLHVQPGQAVEVTLALMFYREPDVLYGDVVPGATFTLREGPTIVGYGTVLSRS